MEQFTQLKNTLSDSSYLDQYAQKMNQVGQATQGVADKGDFLSKNIAPALGQSFQTFFFDLMQGKVKNLEQYLMGFVQSVQKSIAKMLSDKLVAWLISSIRSLFSSDTTVGGVSENYSSGVDVKGNARGGVLAGGFSPIRSYSDGGVVSGPTLGLVGEGRYNEAVVPLPNGSHIPVMFTGGGGGMGGPVINQTVIVNNESGQALNAEQIMGMMKQTGPNQYEQQMIINIVVEDISTGGPTRDAVKRINAGY